MLNEVVGVSLRTNALEKGKDSSSPPGLSRLEGKIRLFCFDMSTGLGEGKLPATWVNAQRKERGSMLKHLFFSSCWKARISKHEYYKKL